MELKKLTRTNSKAPAVFVVPPIGTRLLILSEIKLELVAIESVSNEYSITVLNAGLSLDGPANSRKPIRVLLLDKVVVEMKLVTKDVILWNASEGVIMLVLPSNTKTISTNSCF